MDLSRLEILVSKRKVELLKNSAVAVIGLGGVGGMCAESLVRSGVGRIFICDGDVVEPSNINRQIVALTSTIGHSKAAALKKRLADINPEAEIIAVKKHWSKEEDFIVGEEIDYVVDAIDSLADKVDLVCMCKEQSISIVSAMGAGMRQQGGMFEIADIYKTFNDPLAKRMRKLLKDRGVKELDVVYSTEKPEKADGTIGSAMFAVGVSGLMLSEHVIHSIIGGK